MTKLDLCRMDLATSFAVFANTDTNCIEQALLQMEASLFGIGFQLSVYAYGIRKPVWEGHISTSIYPSSMPYRDCDAPSSNSHAMNFQKKPHIWEPWKFINIAKKYNTGTLIETLNEDYAINSSRGAGVWGWWVVNTNSWIHWKLPLASQHRELRTKE